MNTASSAILVPAKLNCLHTEYCFVQVLGLNFPGSFEELTFCQVSIKWNRCSSLSVPLLCCTIRPFFSFLKLIFCGLFWGSFQCLTTRLILGFPGSSVLKNPSANAGDAGVGGEDRSLGREDPRSSILVWKNPMNRMGPWGCKVRHDWRSMQALPGLAYVLYAYLCFKNKKSKIPSSLMVGGT